MTDPGLLARLLHHQGRPASRHCKAWHRVDITTGRCRNQPGRGVPACRGGPSGPHLGSRTLRIRPRNEGGGWGGVLAGTGAPSIGSATKAVAGASERAPRMALAMAFPARRALRLNRVRPTGSDPAWGSTCANGGTSTEIWVMIISRCDLEWIQAVRCQWHRKAQQVIVLVLLISESSIAVCDAR